MRPMHTLPRLAAAACLAAALVAGLAARAADVPDSKAPPQAKAWAFDAGVAPCDDFYQYVCNAWMKENPIPADQASWGRPNELVERNRETLRQILAAASADDPKRTPAERQIGDFYASCMDDKAIETKGMAALAPELARIAELKSKHDLAPLVAHLQASGADVLFGFGSEQDFKEATAILAIAGQGGMGLPDRDYYLKTDPKSVEQRNAYAAHVERMLALLGEPPAAAHADADAVLELETGLAKVALDAVSRRDPAKLYHRMGRAELAALAPGFDWDAYLAALQAPPIGQINVTEPEFFRGMDRLVAATDLARLKTYLRWQLVHEVAANSLLPAAFVDETFAFYGRTLSGAKELKPRWKRCVQLTDGALGEELGRVYVEKAFPPEAKARTQAMVQAIEHALESDVETLAWMTPPTRQQALVKLHLIANKVGYPEVWRDYGKLEIVRGDALGNLLRADAFELARQLAKIGRPVDRGEWGMSPPTVNAYYNPLMNDINFPAGFLQPPAFDLARDDAYNLGAIGLVIGHELTHGFDDEGRQFDGHGNLKDWWTPADASEFERRATCVADEYSGFTAVGDLKLNGRLTLGENVADNGGARIAFMALEARYKGEPAIDGLTPEQRFFVGGAQLNCENRTPEVERLTALTNPHSPHRYRVNGVVSNMPEFARAFGCKPGDRMVRANACRVW
ncbi:MAG TPA: M13 family metallopeptidase [Thermoanaerobaculia bacterium]